LVDEGSKGLLSDIIEKSTIRQGQALFRLQRYQGLLQNYSEMNIETYADATQISWSTQYGLSTLLSDEVVIGTFIRLSHQLTGNDEIGFRQIRLAHPCPENGDSYEALLKCPVSFGHEANTLTISNRDLNCPINTHEPHLLALYEKQAAALPILDKYNTDESQGRSGTKDLGEEGAGFTRAVACAITENLHKGTPTLEFVAALLNLSPRTLHRKLAASDQNFSSVLTQVRKQLSVLYVGDSTICLADVSQLLGYAEQSVFNRAFKQWHGCTPKQFCPTVG